MNGPIKAGGEAMPMASRRHFLRGAAAATAFTGAAVPVTATPLQESNELSALSTDFDAAVVRFHAAADHLATCREAYRMVAPLPADGLTFSENHTPGHRFWMTDFWVDPTCPRSKTMRGPSNERMRIICSWVVERNTHGWKMHPEVQALRDQAKAYEEAVEATTEACGLSDAIDEYRASEGNLRKTVRALSGVRARTPAGLAIKVRATGAFAALGQEESYEASIWLAKAMWADLEEGA